MAKKRKKTKKLAVVASGWHFPAQFYEAIAAQRLPNGWETELFCVAHREPEAAAREKAGKTFSGPRAELDRALYRSIATKPDLERLGWRFQLEPNTVGDWGNTNQWLETHDYEGYDLLLLTHDDNLILNDVWFDHVIGDAGYDEWGILANSLGMPEGWLRGSCEFFKPWAIRKMGGRFDLSEVSLSMEGKDTVSEDLGALADWNRTVDPVMRAVEAHRIPVGFMSPSYRVSAYCIEGERGYISNTHGQNTAREDEGLRYLHQNGII